MICIIPAMPQRVIPLQAVPSPSVAPVAPPATTGTMAPLDRLGRPLRDLRISLTDRCNFRCRYCMPKEAFGKDHRFLPAEALLDFAEITRLARIFLNLGVRKLRLTGGEPLLRKGLEDLIAELSRLRTLDGAPPDIRLTTNGALLAAKAPALKAAGLQHLTVSLDALDDTLFRQMNDMDFPVAQVLAGIDAAQAAGFAPLKVNMVVQRGVNDGQILPMARHFRARGMVLRFIEYMDVGSTNQWRLDQVLPSAEVLARLQQDGQLIPLPASAPGETARRWAWADAAGQPDPHQGEVGLISSVSQAFCRDCARARLSPQGQLYRCLFAHQGWDLRALLRGSHSDADIQARINALWQARDERYSELRGSSDASRPTSDEPRVEMSYIGG